MYSLSNHTISEAQFTLVIGNDESLDCMHIHVRIIIVIINFIRWGLHYKSNISFMCKMNILVR